MASEVTTGLVVLKVCEFKRDVVKFSYYTFLDMVFSSVGNVTSVDRFKWVIVWSLKLMSLVGDLIGD